MPNSTATLSIEQYVTAQHFFHPCRDRRDHLYAVRPGVPVDRALEHASNLLDSAYNVARQISEGKGLGQGVHAIWAVMHLLDVARATIDASIMGLDPLD